MDTNRKETREVYDVCLNTAWIDESLIIRARHLKQQLIEVEGLLHDYRIGFNETHNKILAELIDAKYEDSNQFPVYQQISQLYYPRANAIYKGLCQVLPDVHQEIKAISFLAPNLWRIPEVWEISLVHELFWICQSYRHHHADEEIVHLIWDLDDYSRIENWINICRLVITQADDIIDQALAKREGYHGLRCRYLVARSLQRTNAITMGSKYNGESQEEGVGG
ncbi:MAG: hypothetical protein M1834_009589 [Cirrosporium novae-zelandiae]|nr:MAG: hypothetical protein M1834_009589 [Cirrosporium novae-zelandiae]